MSNDPVRLLVLGAGRMAARHAERYAEIPGVEVVAVADADIEAARDFAKTHNIPRSFERLEAALDWGEFDAASNVTPDPVHCETTLALLAAGKHVLCEKPLATNHRDAARMAEAADAAGLVHMVNLTYREVPAMQAAAHLVAEGKIGHVRHFEASYLQSWLTQPLWGDWRTESAWLWRLSSAHGSAGVLGDIGIHIVDFMSFVTCSPVASLSCQLQTFDKAPGNRIGQYDLDANDSFTMQTTLVSGAIGTVSATRFASGHINDLFLRVYGDAGGLEIRATPDGDSLRVCLAPNLEQAAWQDMPTTPVETNYAKFIAAIRTDQSADPSFHRGAVLQRVLDLAQRSDAENGRRISIGEESP